MSIWAKKAKRLSSGFGIILGSYLTLAACLYALGQSKPSLPVPPPLPPPGIPAVESTQQMPSFPLPKDLNSPKRLPQLPTNAKAALDLSNENSQQNDEKPLQPFPMVPPPTNAGVIPPNPSVPAIIIPRTQPEFTDLPATPPEPPAQINEHKAISAVPKSNHKPIRQERNAEPPNHVLEKLRKKMLPAFRPVGRKEKVKKQLAPMIVSPKVTPGPGKAVLPVRSEPAIRIQKTGPATGRIGQTLEYRITVQNSGQFTIRKLQIEDQVPAGAEVVDTFPPGNLTKDRITWLVEELAAGAKRVCLVRLRPMESGDMQTTTTASIRVENSFQTKIAGLPLTLQIDGPDTVRNGEKGLFKIRIHNKSAQPVGGLVLTARLPDGLFHEASKDDTKRDISAALPTLKPGENKLIDLDLVAKKTGNFALTVEINNVAGEKRLAKRQVTIRETARLVLKKIGVQQLQSGVETKYRLEVVNAGKEAAKNVVIVDHLPSGLDFVAASDKGKYDPNTQTVQWVVDTIAAGHTKAVELKIKGARDGRYTNQAIAETMDGVRVDLRAELIVGQPNEPLPPPAAPLLPEIPPPTTP